MMEAPFTLILPASTQHETATPCPPAAARNYILPYAISNLVYSIPGATIFRQSIQGSDYYIELFFHELKKPITIEATFSVPSLIFCHTLLGEASVQPQPKNGPFELTAGWYAGYYRRPGSCQIALAGNLHAFFYFAVEWNYLQHIIENYPSLRSGIHSLIAVDSGLQSLSARPINFSVKRIIKRMQMGSWQGLELDIAMLTAIKDLLSQYDKDLQSESYQISRGIIHEIHEYIASHYTETNSCCLARLAEKFHTSERTLLRLFKQEFGITIYQYIKKLRMEMAVQLLSEGNNVNQVSKAVGYKSDFSFSRVFKKYYNCTPQSVKEGQI